jgi:SAM-dependent methyltransferase
MQCPASRGCSNVQRETVVVQQGRPRLKPDRQAALAQYRRRAGIYDFELALFEPVRRRAIDLLAPRQGEVVLDVGCGTGLSFELLERGVGAAGRIVGIEQSPEMIERARERVQRQRWRNVSLICAPAETAGIPTRADAALLHFTHDILQRPEAVANVLRHLKPGARVVASGLKWAPAWLWPVNLAVLPAALHSVTSLEGLDKPWAGLAAALPGLAVRSSLLGGVFVASGAVPAKASPTAAARRRR